jgi:hypothetical protein
LDSALETASSPGGSHATLHSPANAHPLKVVTGKRNLLILDFGDAQLQKTKNTLAPAAVLSAYTGTGNGIFDFETWLNEPAIVKP